MSSEQIIHLFSNSSEEYYVGNRLASFINKLPKNHDFQGKQKYKVALQSIICNNDFEETPKKIFVNFYQAQSVLTNDSKLKNCLKIIDIKEFKEKGVLIQFETSILEFHSLLDSHLDNLSCRLLDEEHRLIKFKRGPATVIQLRIRKMMEGVSQIVKVTSSAESDLFTKNIPSSFYVSLNRAFKSTENLEVAILEAHFPNPLKKEANMEDFHFSVTHSFNLLNEEILSEKLDTEVETLNEKLETKAELFKFNFDEFDKTSLKWEDVIEYIFKKINGTLLKNSSLGKIFEYRWNSVKNPNKLTLIYLEKMRISFSDSLAVYLGFVLNYHNKSVGFTHFGNYFPDIEVEQLETVQSTAHVHDQNFDVLHEKFFGGKRQSISSFKPAELSKTEDLFQESSKVCMIYSNLVKSSVVGNKYVPILKTFTLSGQEKGIRPEVLDFFPLNTGIQNVYFEIRDYTGKLVRFGEEEHGKNPTIITLKVRERRMSNEHERLS